MIVEFILVRDEKIEGQRGEATSPKLPRSHSQVESTVQSGVLAPSLVPFLFSVSILADEGIVLSLIDPAQGL